jgi:hypothetical protein
MVETAAVGVGHREHIVIQHLQYFWSLVSAVPLKGDSSHV